MGPQLILTPNDERALDQMIDDQISEGLHPDLIWDEDGNDSEDE